MFIPLYLLLSRPINMQNTSAAMPIQHMIKNNIAVFFIVIFPISHSIRGCKAGHLRPLL